MKFVLSRKFEADWKKLPIEHKKTFKAAVPAFNKACDEYVKKKGSFSWPANLRVKPMQGAPGIWEMTWSFSSPDGRATFEFSLSADGTSLIWRRIGTHSIYDNP